MPTAQQITFNQVIIDAQSLLQTNPEWENRYKKYAEDISVNIDWINSVRSSFREWSPLKLYLTTTNAKNASQTVRFELRFLGQAVADLICKDEPKIDTKRFDVTNKRDFDCEVTLSKVDWKGKEAREFRKHFRTRLTARNTSGNKANEEHRIENLLLTEFSKKQSKEKALVGIQPVKIAKVRYPMPTPLSASDHKYTSYAGPSGGGIDILTRVRIGGRATNLCIMEVKDENKASEPPTDAVKQAIAYATFIRELLRSESGQMWWKLFGFSGNVPKKLVLFATCVMPSNANNDYSFANMPLDIIDNKGEDKILLHYLYFTEDNNEITDIDTSL